MRYGKDRVYALLNEKLLGTISPGENRLLEQLIAEDADTAVLWEQMKALHIQRGEAMSYNIDEDNAWDKLRSRLDLPAESTGRTRRIWDSRWPQISMVAASVAIIAILIFVIVPDIRQPNVPAGFVEVEPVIIEKPPIAEVQLATATGVIYNLSGKSKTFTTTDGAVVKAGNGEVTFDAPVSASSNDLNTLKVPARHNYHIRLCDGTEVWLNAASTLWFPFAFSNTTRDVYVEGEALFKVAKNASQPFIVHTKGTDVRVLGTTFNVNTYENDRVYTSLVEGFVLTYSLKDTICLKPGDQSVYNEESGLEKKSFSADEVLSWRQGIYRFHDASLKTILNMASKWYGIRIRFDDPHTCDFTFSGEINKDKPVAVLLENLQLSSDVRFSWVDQDLHVRVAK